MTSKLADTSVLPASKVTIETLIGPFQSSPMSITLNQGVQINTIYYRTYHSLSYHHPLSQTHLLIHLSTHIISPPLGAPSLSNHSSSLIFPPTQKLPPETYSKHIVAYPSTIPNGHCTSSELQKMHTASTPQLLSAQDFQVEYMATSATHHSPFSDHRVLAQSPHGSMTTSP